MSYHSRRKNDFLLHKKKARESVKPPKNIDFRGPTDRVGRKGGLLGLRLQRALMGSYGRMEMKTEETHDYSKPLRGDNISSESPPAPDGH